MDTTMDNSTFTPRSPLPDIVARLHMKRRFFRREQVNTQLFSLGMDSCIIKSDENFALGDHVNFDLILSMPFEDLVIEPWTVSLPNPESTAATSSTLLILRYDSPTFTQDSEQRLRTYAGGHQA